MLGLEPSGNDLVVNPTLPKGINHIELLNIRAAGATRTPSPGKPPDSTNTYGCTRHWALTNISQGWVDTATVTAPGNESS